MHKHDFSAALVAVCLLMGCGSPRTAPVPPAQARTAEPAEQADQADQADRADRADPGVAFQATAPAPPPTQAFAAAPAPPRPSVIPAALRGHRVAVSMDVQGTSIHGGHHEGLLKVRQPWIFGLKKEQKQMIYDNAPQVAALAFCAELQDQGLVVNPDGAALALTGTLKSLTVNTYGNGTVEGFGSAGDYWDARVDFVDLQLTDLGSGAVLWQGSPSGYARLSPCPAHLDWTMLDVLTKSLKGAMILSKLKTAGNPMGILKNGKDYVYNFEGSYTMGDLAVTPIDAAARRAATDVLSHASWPIQ